MSRLVLGVAWSGSPAGNKWLLMSGLKGSWGGGNFIGNPMLLRGGTNIGKRESGEKSSVLGVVFCCNREELGVFLSDIVKISREDVTV